MTVDFYITVEGLEQFKNYQIVTAQAACFEPHLFKIAVDLRDISVERLSFGVATIQRYSATVRKEDIEKVTK